MGNYVKEAFGKYVTKQLSQCNRVVIEAEFHLPVYDVERARQYCIWKGEKILQNNLVAILTLSPSPVSIAEHIRQYE
ncbi:Hypothetical protein CINCED_3A022853 [Cinara cedri]|uniref:Uncharacterized protein n=1 Tax=Cinara cedri TaxID=506608 RepID=A0A5E4MJ07_9HEMI|nr:Hypothetical protein CINCED_3A022853 [Cinara cedri]